MAEIQRDGETGRAVVSGTDAEVQAILHAFAAGRTLDEIAGEHAGLDRDGIEAALRFAAHAVDRDYEYRRPEGTASRLAQTPVVFGAASRYAALEAPDDDRERLLYEVEFLNGLLDGLEAAQAGKVIPHEEVAARMRARFGV